MQSRDQFFSFSPKDPLLKGKIAYYYIHYSDDPKNDLSFQYFPHFRNALTVYLNADLKLEGMNSRVKEGARGNYNCIFSKNYSESVSVRILGRFWKLGIAFEPLGYNHFIPKPLSEWLYSGQNDVSVLEADLESIVLNCYQSNPESCVEILDAYFLLRMSPLKDGNRLRQILHFLMDVNTERNVQELSAELNLDRRTLLRLVQKHLCTSVKEYQQLVKFRLALNNYIEAGKETTFTELAYNHRYYDQPAFIRHFKKITDKTPRNFFKHIHRFGTFDTYWAK